MMDNKSHVTYYATSWMPDKALETACGTALLDKRSQMIGGNILPLSTCTRCAYGYNLRTPSLQFMLIVKDYLSLEPKIKLLRALS